MTNYFPKDNPPEIPPDTCLYINFIQEVLDQIKNETDSRFLEARLQLVGDTLEYIRDSNDALRKSGKYWKRKFDNKGRKK